VSRFGGGNRANKKKTVIDRLKAYFEKFYGIGGNTGFMKKNNEVKCTAV
jgi:type I restriction enzyme R subunit